MNVFLDLFFVITLQMGVAGAAWATIISEAVSMCLVIYVLMKTNKEYKVHLNQLKIEGRYLKEIVKIGVPAGLQGMVVSVSNVIVMSYINGFGSASVAGFSSANKFDNFLGLPVNSFALAITTFVGQNLGAKKYDRVKKGVHATLILSIVTVILLGGVVFAFADQCISFFSQDSEVIQAGATCIKVMCPFYFALCLHQVYSGALRASGRSSVPMVTSIMAFVVIRQIFLAIVLQLNHNIAVVGWGYSLTWILAASFTAFYYFTSHWLKVEESRDAL
jgi:putative efflux protein, MATE family